MSCITVNAEEPKPATFEDLGYVQVVRCKDCKFAEKQVFGRKQDAYKCTLSAFEGLYDYHDRDWFCADGEKR